MQFKRTILATSIMALLPTLTAPLALAQGAGQLEEVVVTAQKRAQSAQDIGISIVALSGDQLRDRNIVNTSDLAKVIPNVLSIPTAAIPTPYNPSAK